INEDFDNSTSFLGDYGFFQISMMVLLSLSIVPSGNMDMISVFMSDTPEYHCKASLNSTLNSSRIGPDSCSRNKVTVNWTETAGQSNDTEPCLDGWVFSTEMYTATIVSEWDLVCDNAWKVPFSTSIYFIGILFGSIISGHLSDRFGRKPVFFLTMLLQAVTTLIQAASVSWLMFCILNCMRGLMSAYVASLTLGSEMLSNSARVFFSAVCHCLGYGIGYALLPLFAYFIRGWRMLLVAAAIPSALFIPLLWVIPESPRWLLHKGRVEEAELIIRNAAKWNKVPAPEVIFRDQTEGGEERTYNYVDFICNTNLRNITILGVFIWFSVSVVYFGLSLNTSNLNGNPYLNCFISAAIDIMAYIAIWLLVNHVPRPTLLFCTLMFCGVMLLVTQLIPQEMQVMLQVFALGGKIGVAGAYCFIFMFFTELFPTVVRNMGLGVVSTASHIGIIISPYFIYMGVHMKILPFIIFGTSSIVAGAVSMLLPDTRNSKLPDVISQTRLIRGAGVQGAREGNGQQGHCQQCNLPA
uniref:Major facilitator superfamily (MFS) profile domain-containing protein n=1 Tax=Mola mola TaxID=94237 RepID=A0A3Q3WAM5_MOLML